MDKLISQQIATFIGQIDYNNLPENVINKAKQCLLDAIGVSLYGSAFKASNMVLPIVEEFTATKESTIIGKKEKTTCFLAAMINGVSAHIADYDDSLLYFGHSSGVLMAALLPMAEKLNSSGKELLTAFVLGAEVGSKVGKLMGLKHYKVGFHQTSTIGILAASVALAKLMKLDKVQTVNSIGIATSNASGIRQNFGTMTKALHVGHASSMAIFSVLLSQRGFDASDMALEGPVGFINAFQGEDNNFNFSTLGNPYAILKIRFKRYPSCAMTHPCVDAALKFREKAEHPYEDIKEINCEMTERAGSILIYANPTDAQQGKFSIEYCVAAALISGELGPNQFTEQYFQDKGQELRAIMKKVTRKYNIELDEIAKIKELANPSRFTVLFKNGEGYQDFIEQAIGGPEQPLSWQSIEEKFLQCCEGIIKPSDGKEIVELIKNIENIKNIKNLTDKL